VRVAIAGAVVTVRRGPAWANDGAFHTAVLAEQPGCYTSNYSLGAWIASEEKNIPKARPYFERAVAIAGDSDRGVNARNNLATSYEYGPSYVRYGADAPLERALAVYDETLQVKPDSATASINAAIVCDRLAARHGATPSLQLEYRRRGFEHYQRGLRLQPDHFDARNWWRRTAEIAEQLGRREEARHAYRRAAQARAAVFDMLVRIQGERGRRNEIRLAVAELERALALGPPPQEAAELQSELRAWRAR